MKKLCLFVALVMTGCGQSTPRQILTEYLKASLHGRYEEAYQYISTRDKQFKTLEQYLAEEPKEESPLAEVVSDKVSYEIIDVKLEGEEAVAAVAVTLPDVSELLRDAFGTALLSTLGDEETKKKAAEKLVEKYQDGDVPLTTINQSFELIRESDGWRVFLGWEYKSVFLEARDLKREGKLRDALKKYARAVELKPDSEEAKEGLRETEKEIKDFREKQAYIRKVELRNFRVARGSRFGFGEPEPGVFGKIVNTGDRTLEKVVITVFFLGKEGKPIAEHDYHPVLVTKLSFGGDNTPLKPGYIRDFGYIVGDYAPSDWSGKVTGQVSDIEFQD